MRFIDPYPSGPSCNDRLHLLGLPAELRNNIYAFAILSEDLPLVCDDGKTRRHVSPLLQTSSQIRRESLKIYFMEKTFTVALDDLSIGVFKTWLYTVAGSYSDLITRLTLFIPLTRMGEIDDGSPFLYRTLLKGLVGRGNLLPETIEVKFDLPENYLLRFNEICSGRTNFSSLSRQQLQDMVIKVRRAEKMVEKTLPEIHERLRTEHQGRSRSV